MAEIICTDRLIECKLCFYCQMAISEPEAAAFRTLDICKLSPSTGPTSIPSQISITLHFCSLQIDIIPHPNTMK